jgi:hypothetical protein
MDHTVYTRLYITSAFADLPDAQAVAGRLLRNQEDIGNAIVPFYGKDAGNKLTDLLKQHIAFKMSKHNNSLTPLSKKIA